jgi:hypothetical protein
MSRQTKRVHIRGEIWTYQVGSTAVSIRSPSGHRTVVHRHALVKFTDLGLDFAYPEPARVRDYIWRKLIPDRIFKTPRDRDHAKEMIFDFFFGAGVVTTAR